MQLTIDAEKRIFKIDTANTSYAVQITPEDRAVNLYWGAKLDRLEDLPSFYELSCYRHMTTVRTQSRRQEYPVYYGDFQMECALKAAYADGVRRIVGKFLGHETDGDTLKLHFADAEHPLKYTLCYRVSAPELDLIERSTILENTGDEVIRLDAYASATWQFPRKVHSWRLTHLNGHWGKESMVSQLPVQPGRFVLDSRTGVSGPYHVPFFALDDGSAAQNCGEVYFGSVEWAGNWKITIEQDPYYHTAVTGGINDFDNVLELQGHEVFHTPVFYGGYTKAGFNGMSRQFHRLTADHLLPRPIAERPMPVMFNSWGCMFMDVSEEKILAAIDKAERIGAELFVIDDGWQQHLGDWTPDKQKFPNGLGRVIEAAKKKGMIFGLWVEIESYEIQSKLYQAHPEWQMCYPGCKPFTVVRGCGRTTVMLDFSNPEVADYFYHQLHDLVANTGIRYLKLDMNVYVTSPSGKGRIWIDYVKNLTGLFQKLSDDFPDLLIENCASGAARASLAMNHMFGRMNRSDNQDALDMLKLHYGFTYLQAPRLAGGACHISDSMYGINLRRTPLGFQAACGMLGSLACGKALTQCTDAELDEIRKWTDLYKKLRPVTNFADFYRLSDPNKDDFAAFWYVAHDKKAAVLFLLGQNVRFADRMPFLPLPGLQEDAVYQIECFNNIPDNGGYTARIEYNVPKSGRALQEIGVAFELRGDYDFRILRFQAK